MKIGLYFGTFDPIHIGHLIIANHLIEFYDLEEIWLVVTPHNPHKQKTDLLQDKHRLEMVRVAIEDHPKLKISDVEFKLSQPNYTFETLVHLEKMFPEHRFSLIIGEDNLNSFDKWKNYKTILERYEIYVYPRTSKLQLKNTFLSHPKIRKINAEMIDVSSTQIRKAIQEKKNVSQLLPKKVLEYIEKEMIY